MKPRFFRSLVLFAMTVSFMACGQGKQGKREQAQEGTGDLLRLVSADQLAAASERSAQEVADLSQEEFIALMVKSLKQIIADLESGELAEPADKEERSELIRALKKELDRLQNDSAYQDELYEQFQSVANGDMPEPPAECEMLEELIDNDDFPDAEFEEMIKKKYDEECSD